MRKSKRHLIDHWENSGYEVTQLTKFAPSTPSVTVQDERALREAVRAIVQLVQNGEWADLLHTDPDAVALWDAVDGLLRRAAHPVQDGEKDAKGGAA